MLSIPVKEELPFITDDNGTLILPPVEGLVPDDSFYVRFGTDLKGLFINKDECLEFGDVLTNTIAYLVSILSNNDSNDPTNSLLKYRIETLTLLVEGLNGVSLR